MLVRSMLSLCLGLGLLLAACGQDRADSSSAAATRGAPEAKRSSPAARATVRGVRLVTLARFDEPVYITAPPGDARRLFVVEQRGRIRVVRSGKKLRRPFLDIANDVSAGGERGLLSVAFAPDYQRTGKLYVYFTNRGGDLRIEEFERSRRNPERADSRRRRLVLSQEHSAFANHNGGQLQFGPDGLLYAGLGDGGGGGDPNGNAQNLQTRLGKLLRIAPGPGGGRAYRIPAGNPFRSRADARPEIYAYGLRNPYRFSFDRRSGDLAIGDVGQDQLEEIDFVPAGKGAGANFGWNRFEGTRRFSEGSAPGHVPPVLEYGRSHGECSVIGGYVVRDRALGGLYGSYLYGDFCTGELRSAVLRPGSATGDRALGLKVSSLSSFGEDSRGRLYATSLEGPVYRLAAR